MKRSVLLCLFVCVQVQAMDFRKKIKNCVMSILDIQENKKIIDPEFDEELFKKCVVLERYYALNDELRKHQYPDKILNTLYPCHVYGCGNFTQKSALFLVLYSYGTHYELGDKTLFAWKTMLQNLARQSALKANYTVKGVGQQFFQDSPAYTYSLLYILVFKGRYFYTSEGSLAVFREWHVSPEMQEYLAPALEALELLRDYGIRFNKYQGVWVHEKDEQKICFYSLFHVLKDCYAWRYASDEDKKLLKNIITCLLDMDIDATVGASYLASDSEDVGNNSSLTVNDCCGDLDVVFKEIFNQAVEENVVKKETLAYLKSIQAKFQNERLQGLCKVCFAFM